MEFFSLSSYIILMIVSLVQSDSNFVNVDAGGNFNSNSDRTTREPPIEASTCPQNSTISPCTCTKDSSGISISCLGSAVNQTSVGISFRELRRANEIPEDRGVDIYEFKLESTRLTQFDLAPLYQSRMERLCIWYNYKLTKLVTSGNPEDHRSIHVDLFDLLDAPINGDQFGDTLKYLSVQMTIFYAWNYFIINPNNNNNNNMRNIDDGELEFKFLPGLSAFVNLYYLGLEHWNISGRLNSSHFKAFPRLEYILLQDNEIDGIGENVFSSNVSYIYLGFNKLNETSFHPESGIAHNQTGSRKELYLEHNQITTLPSEIFQTYLDAHPQNQLYLYANPLICDERLSWIKSRREEFQLRVNDAGCSNDPGHTVFDSDLIP